MTETLDGVLNDAAYLPGTDPVLTELLLYSVRFARLLLGTLDEELRPRHLDVSQHAVLSVLWLAGPPHQIAPKTLGHMLVQTSGGMTKTLDRLEAGDLIARIPDPADGRGRVVALTPLGSDVVRSSLRDVVAKLDDTLSSADAADRAALLATQKRLGSLFDR